MPVNLEPVTSLSPIPGVRLASAAAGIRYTDRTDLSLIEFAEGTRVAAVFTRNRFCAAPVLVAREHMQAAAPRYLLINSGNANAGTGEAGLEDARDSCAALAALTGLEVQQVLPFSTGVIGERLPVKRLVMALPELVAALAPDHWVTTARAIMTTDTIPKGVSKTVALEGGEVTITGICKGAGMIRPDMATMLAYIATDAMIGQEALQQLLNEANALSFNAITVDGDTSTNDACIFAATGQSGIGLVSDLDRTNFSRALNEVMQHLAQALIRDSEGATKFVTIKVDQARSVDEARTVAYTIAHSPLVKTALFASDPNWGRILAAVGRAPIESLDLGGVNIRLGDVKVISAGEPDATYTEARGQLVMDQDEILIHVGLGRGSDEATIWTSDLSYDYVKINADYRS
ncbi:MAG: bifunctional glutamate N-acetyltransferase/amino-acid acetyltransferase ArgJ [Thiotrichales bacterium]